MDAACGVVAGGDVGAGSVEDEVTASGTGGEAGAGPDGLGVQPAASSTSNTKRIAIAFILVFS